MKVQRIFFKNIHSLKGEHSIDFEKPPLSETGIFAIVGPTGSGKSTLLDVIMLALFAQIPRINEKITTKEVAEMGTVLTRNTDEAFAVVEYRTKGKTYRSKWSISKARTGNFRDYDMELAELPSEKIIEEKKSEVVKRNEEIIGLNYQQFLKSIVLSQGEFSKFLKANENERAEMLEKITGTEIYREIGKKAFEVAKEYKEKVDKQMLLLNSIMENILSEDDRRNLTNELESKKIKIESLKKDKQKIETTLTLKKEINDLQLRYSKILELLKDNQDKLEQFQTESNKITLYEKLIVYKSDFKELEINKNNLNQTESKITFVQEQLKNLNEKFLNIETQFAKNETKLKEFQQLNLDLKSIYEKAETIENDLKLLNENLKIQTENFNKATVEEQNINRQFSDYSEKISNANEQIKIKQQWIEKYTGFENLNSDINLIISKLDLYNNSKINTDNLLSKSKHYDKFKNLEWKNYSQATLKELEKLNAQIDKLNSVVTIDEKVVLNNNYDKKQAIVNALERLTFLSENYSELDKTKAKQEDTIKNNKNKNTELEEILRKTQNEFEIVEKRIEELDKRLEREKLEAKYEQDRLNLKKDMPCPLCGSKDHPFAQHSVAVQKSETEQLLKESKTEKKKLDELISNYRLQIAQIQQQIATAEQQLDVQVQKMMNLKNEISTLCEQNKISIDCFDTNVLMEFSKNNKTELNIIEDKLKKIDKLQVLIIEKQDFENIAEKIEIVLSNRKDLTDILLPYKSLWQNTNDLNKIVELLIQFSKKYEIQKNEIEKLNSEVKSLSEGLKQIEFQKKEKQQKRTEISEQLEKFKNSVDKQNANLKELENNYFKGNSRTVFQEQLQLKIEELRNLFTTLSNEKMSLKTSIEEKNNSLLELNQTLSKTKQNFETKYKELSLNLKKIGIDSVEKALNYLLEEDEYEKLKSIKKQLEDDNNILKDNKIKTQEELKIKTELDTDQRSYSEISDLKDSIELQFEELNKEIGSLNQKLKNDDILQENSKSHIENLEKLKKETARWERLRSLIGSKTGDTFAKIAQQFTLNYLINFANKHLEEFTDRYVLDKSGESKNNLFVYDRNMGMAKRAVQTLSGGETFLVSLSLALALSDLASRNTRLESLFIDEGFATLDEETLDRALVNLEKLHINTKRTIGLISHVQLIKERITTKIVLEKTNSGFSNITII